MPSHGRTYFLASGLGDCYWNNSWRFLRVHRGRLSKPPTSIPVLEKRKPKIEKQRGEVAYLWLPGHHVSHPRPELRPFSSRVHALAPLCGTTLSLGSPLRAEVKRDPQMQQAWGRPPAPHLAASQLTCSCYRETSCSPSAGAPNDPSLFGLRSDIWRALLPAARCNLWPTLDKEREKQQGLRKPGKVFVLLLTI